MSLSRRYGHYYHAYLDRQQTREHTIKLSTGKHRRYPEKRGWRGGKGLKLRPLPFPLGRSLDGRDGSSASLPTERWAPISHQASSHEMVSAHIVEAIRDPSGIIIDLYNEGRSAEVNFPAQVTTHFATVFDTQDSIQQVSIRCMQSPAGTHASTKDSVTLSQLPSGCLSRQSLGPLPCDDSGYSFPGDVPLQAPRR